MQESGMTLLDYIASSGRPLAQIAAECGYDRSSLSAIAHGRRRPSASQAVAIERATEGQVEATQFFTDADLEAFRAIAKGSAE
jgi:DNA-binding transcriptional regulator YdaS (Cro superfamily)